MDEETTFKEIEALDQQVDAADKRVDALLDARERADNRTPDLRYIRGIGRFAIPYTSGWKDLERIIQDKSLNIDFSMYDYPVFDGVVQQHFNRDALVNPLNPDYETFIPLRNNIASVRNFLVMHYFSNDPDPKTAKKAEQSLRDMAKYLGTGLHNNSKVLGIIPYNDPTKPYVDLELANLPGGEGASYIYERLLAMQRQSDWMRPFTAVTSLFGGKMDENWELPELEDSPFTHDGGASLDDGPPDEVIEEAITDAEALRDARNAKRVETRQKSMLHRMALDLDALGSQLLFGAQNGGGIAGLSEPVRTEAVEIAKDILKKLKIKFGDKNILDGLKLSPQDDVTVIGGVQGVAMVYERLLSYARTIDVSILSHPAVSSATQALGQIGYLAKLEAMSLANQAGSTQLADNIAVQLQRTPKQFSQATDSRLGGLLERVENGIDTVLNRIQQISGPQAMVGNSIDHNIDGAMNSAPIAGMEMRLKTSAKSKQAQTKAFQLTEAIENSQRAQAQRIQQSLAGDAARRGGVSTAINRNSTGRQALTQARENARQAAQRTSFSRQNPAAYIPTYIRSGANRTRDKILDHQHHDTTHHGHDNPAQAVVAKLDPRIIQGIRASTRSGHLGGEVVGPRSARDAVRSQIASQKQPDTSMRQNAVQNVLDGSKSASTKPDDILRPDPVPGAPNKGGRGI